jgi:hypothetical protein
MESWNALNREVRKMLRAYFVQNNNKRWIDVLDAVESNKNETFHSTIKTFPNEIWTPENVKRRASSRRIPTSILESDPLNNNRGIVINNTKRMQEIALNNVIKKVKSDVGRFKKTELEVGDLVRVSDCDFKCNETNG